MKKKTNTEPHDCKIQMTKCHRLVQVANGETMEEQERGDRAAGKAGTQQAKHGTELLGKPETT